MLARLAGAVIAVGELTTYDVVKHTLKENKVGYSCSFCIVDVLGMVGVHHGLPVCNACQERIGGAQHV